VIVIIGRGHGGTRLASSLLIENGVATGSVLNRSLDMLPPRHMYKAADLYSQYVEYRGNYTWDFTKANALDTPEEFTDSIDLYLTPIADLPEPKFFKIPETTLCYPWLTRVLPDAAYIYWVRDPRDASRHLSDRMEMWDYWDIDLNPHDPLTWATSWKYQYDIVKSVPPPERFITIRYEDFCLDQEREAARLSEFLGIDLAPLTEPRPDSIYKWTRKDDRRQFDFLEPAIKELGYDVLPPGYGNGA
jgi:Sulfotransferase family